MFHQNMTNDQLIAPDYSELSYSGRIDFSNPSAPCFIYASSSVSFRFRGTSVKVIIQNLHDYWNNFLGFVIDDQLPNKVQLELHDNATIYTIAEQLPDTEHTVTIFKRQDSAHYFYLHGILLNKEAEVLTAPQKPARRIECYGDSVSCGEVSEAISYVGKPDPEHNGEYSNSWYSYTSFTARNLGAELHNISQGGIALLDGSGYFRGPDYVGLMGTYDKLSYNSALRDYSDWDFERYTPHVVLIAIGQNDTHPDDYMGIDLEKSDIWIKNYTTLVKNIRGHYPNALIILKTTILNHRVEWDEAIENITNDLNDPKIVHFKYSNNGCGTPGHIRISEAQQMAVELTAFIEQFGPSVWE